MVGSIGCNSSSRWIEGWRRAAFVASKLGLFNEWKRNSSLLILRVRFPAAGLSQRVGNYLASSYLMERTKQVGGMLIIHKGRMTQSALWRLWMLLALCKKVVDIKTDLFEDFLFRSLLISDFTGGDVLSLFLLWAIVNFILCQANTWSIYSLC